MSAMYVHTHAHVHICTYVCVREVVLEYWGLRSHNNNVLCVCTFIGTCTYIYVRVSWCLKSGVGGGCNYLTTRSVHTYMCTVHMYICMNMRTHKLC